MSRTTASTFNTLLMFPPIANQYVAGFYQDLLQDIQSYQQLGDRLIQLGEQAHAFRQFDRVKDIAEFLSNIPLKHYQQIGHYYLAVATNNNGSGDQGEARKLFELVAETAPPGYRAKAILSLAAVSSNTKDFQSQLDFLIKAAGAARDISTKVRAHLGIAIYKSMEGFHRQSLNDLENLYPLARLCSPAVYFDYLNSLAIECGEAGRINEARNIIKHVVASPFAFAYPEWQETAQELKEPDRSLVTVPMIKREPVEIKQHASKEVEAARPGTVIAFPPLKEAPEPKRPERVKSSEVAGMDMTDKKEFLMTAIRTEMIPETELNRMMYMFGLVECGPADQVLDLEDKALLHDLIQEWCYTIDPGELAGVISALRDCEDDQRRESIMDDIIMFAYQHTPAHLESESAWRRKVERRLPEK